MSVYTSALLPYQVSPRSSGRLTHSCSMRPSSDFSIILSFDSLRNDLFGGAFVIFVGRSLDEPNERLNILIRRRPRPGNERRNDRRK